MPRNAARERAAAPRGRVRGHQVADYVIPPRGEDDSVFVFKTGTRIPTFRPATKFKSNLILREWAAIVGRLLLRQPEYAIAGMYVEFANSASPVAPPAYDRDVSSGVAYYNSLSGDPTNDYLRVQLISGVLNTADAAVYPNGNTPTFFAMTTGVTGVHGKTFSDAADSRVIGAALVAMPDETDATRDLVLSRFYFDEAEQLPKLPTGQVGIEWEIALQ